MDEKPPALVAMFEQLGNCLYDTQVLLDEQAIQDIVRWHGIAERLPESNAIEEIARIIHPDPLHISELQIQLDVELERMKQREGDVSLNIAGRPVHSFYRRRFGEKNLSSSRIEIVYQTVPVTQSVTLQPKQDKDISHG